MDFFLIYDFELSNMIDTWKHEQDEGGLALTVKRYRKIDEVKKEIC